MASRRPYVGGNWKMHTDQGSARALARQTATGVGSTPRVEVAVFAPFCYLIEVARALTEAGGPVTLGAQDCYHEPEGAFTGEISAGMLRDCGARAALAGHSERRHVLGESDDLVRRKTHAILGAGLTCILCIGETLEQREAHETDAVNRRQLRSALEGLEAPLAERLIIAYEPVWAIGTGRTATPADAQDAHGKIRAEVGKLLGAGVAGAMRIIYGGSVKADNAAELFAQPDIDGGLVGGASLDAQSFVRIVQAAKPE
ncbi:MAG: triose-phosphate isomerase [Phycisphaerales bacterium JB039]